MRKFLITVNGNSYEVEVEEVSAFERKQPPPQREAETQPKPSVQHEASKAVVQQPIEKPAPVELPATGTKVNAPMPGKIISVKVGPGQAVKRGDVLMVLEAMKMENEIQSPVAGAITAIAVSEGANVNAGALLACIG